MAKNKRRQDKFGRQTDVPQAATGATTVTQARPIAAAPNSPTPAAPHTPQPLRTRQQQYAEQALRSVNVRSQSDNAKKYKARADGFPVMVMQAGLAQAVGFMLAKATKDAEYGDYLDDLAATLSHAGAGTFADRGALHGQVIAAHLPEYRRLTREALAAAAWLKRMAQARIVEEPASKIEDTPSVAEEAR